MAKDKGHPLALETTLSTTLHKLAENKKAQLVLAIILILVAIRMFMPDSLPSDAQVVAAEQRSSTGLAGIQQYQNSLERQLAATLSQVKGAGQVTVMLTLSATSELQLAMNVEQTTRTTEDREGETKTRVSQEAKLSSQPVMSRSGSGDSVVTTTELMPRINGVLVIASGAGDPRIQEALTRATQTILSLPAHRVQILHGK